MTFWARVALGFGFGFGVGSAVSVGVGTGVSVGVGVGFDDPPRRDERRLGDSSADAGPASPTNTMDDASRAQARVRVV
jgi:hypothetical protein